MESYFINLNFTAMRTMILKATCILFFLSVFGLYTLANNTVEKKGVIVVEVMDSNLKFPIFGAEVKLYEHTDKGWVEVGKMTTGRGGDVVFANLKVGGKYKVEVSNAGYNSQAHEFSRLSEKENVYFFLTEKSNELCLGNLIVLSIF